jgi:hypothetical protein
MRNEGDMDCGRGGGRHKVRVNGSDCGDCLRGRESCRHGSPGRAAGYVV